MALFSQLVELFYCETICFYRNVAAVVGALYLVRLLLCQLWQLFGGFYAFFLHGPMGHLSSQPQEVRTMGRFISMLAFHFIPVVTGASEGIGRGYALELARRGLNVVIMSRSQDKLQKVADEIKEKYSHEVCIIAVDFSDGLEIYPKIAENLQDLDIGILVNNVGCGQGYPEYFTKVLKEQQYRIVQVNCHPIVQMTRMLLPKMVNK